jgi:hypothetical protein
MLRILMSVFGIALYVAVVRLLAIEVSAFCPNRRTYNLVGRLPYLAAAIFECIAGLCDPLGLKLLFVSTVPAAFGGSSGLLWADVFLPKQPSHHTLAIRRQLGIWIAAVVLGAAYIIVLGRGIQFKP